MKFSAVLVGIAAGTAVTPVEKVIQLLNGMLEKGKEEKHKEQVQFASYKQFCEDTSVDKARAIKAANSKIKKAQADEKKARADASRLQREIDEHNGNIATFEGDKKAATSVRNTENKDYIATHQDYSESIDALGRAIETLKAQPKKRAQAESLLQLKGLIPEEKMRLVTEFLSQAPEAHGYEFQSNSVIEMLEGLKDKFEDELRTLENEESNSAHAFDMLMQDLANQIESNTAARDEKTATRAKRLQVAADRKGTAHDTTITRDEDQKYLDDLKATCEFKASDFASRQQLRAEEIEAIEKAIEIISSGAVAGSAKKHLPTLVQVRSFIQLKTSEMNVNSDKALFYLQRRAVELHSTALTQLAARVSADPFKKVKDMVRQLITRLMEEANAEAEQKGWCDTELAKNEATRKEKTSKVESLHAEVDSLESTIERLTNEIDDLNKGVTELQSALAEATKLRNEENEENKATIADAKAAQAAVANALEVLKTFYAKAGNATALLQQQPEAPEIFDTEYKGMQSENGGVVGMLEVIQSDFARLEAETTAAENTAQEEFDTFKTDTDLDLKGKRKDIEHKTAKKQDSAQDLTSKKEDLTGTQNELDAALDYFDKLKPTCIDSGTSYEERVKRREEEIQSLKEALEILQGEAV